MFDYSPINTYPCTPPGAATNIKKDQVNFDGVLLEAQLFAEKQSIESGWSEKFPIKRNTISK